MTVCNSLTRCFDVTSLMYKMLSDIPKGLLQH